MEEEGGAITTHSRACGLRGVAFCTPAVPFPREKNPACMCAHLSNPAVSVRACRCVCNHNVQSQREAYVYALPCAYSHTHSDIGARTHRRNQLFDLSPVHRGENNPTTSSDSRMRADEHRESQGMLQYTRDGTSRRYTRSSPPVRPLPPSPCYCCDLMKCYARSPAITFPLHRLTPHSVGHVSRRGTVGHLSSLTIPRLTASVRGAFLEIFISLESRRYA